MPCSGRSWLLPISSEKAAPQAASSADRPLTPPCSYSARWMGQTSPTPHSRALAQMR